METANSPTLNYVANLHLGFGPPAIAGSTPRGQYIWAPITHGALSTTDCSRTIASVPAGSGDYMRLDTANLVTHAEMSYVAQTETGDIFRLQHSGRTFLDPSIVEGMGYQVPENINPLTQTVTGWNGTLGCLELIRRNTSCTEFLWMNFTELLGVGKLILGDKGPEGIQYELFQPSNNAQNDTTNSDLPSTQPKLRQVGTLRFDTRRPVVIGKGNPMARMWVPIVDGFVRDIDGESLVSITGGGDHIFRHAEDGVLELNISVTGADQDGATCLFENHGYLHVVAEMMIDSDPAKEQRAGYQFKIPHGLLTYGGFDGFI